MRVCCRHRRLCTPMASGAVPGVSVQEKCEPGTLGATQDSVTSSVGETQAEKACTRQPQATAESRRSQECEPEPTCLHPRPSPARSLPPGSRRCLRCRGSPLTCGRSGSAAPGWAAQRSTGLRWAARPASVRLGSARSSLGSARLGSARRCPERSQAAHAAARGGLGAG